MASEYWKNACNLELTALQGHKTWSIVSLPPGHNVVGCKWVFTIKYNSDGTVEMYKARLVAKGYTQEEGVDYFDTFSPVAKLTTVKLLLGVAAIKNWTLTQMDVSNAFLHGELDEEIYMSLPQGYTPPDDQPLPPNVVCKLHKSLYGLKQVSRQWYQKLSAVILDAGFKQSSADHTLFTRKTGDIYVAVLIYVDDIVIASNNEDAEKELKAILHREFNIKDLGPIQFFLGLEIARSKKGISVCQRKYALDLIEYAGLLACKPCAVPMDSTVQLSKEDGEALPNPTVYMELVGKILYLTITRPNITYAVHKLSQFLSNPSGVHLTAAQRVIRYLKSNPGQGLLFPSDSDLNLSAFADADWGACLDSRRSVSGYCVFLGHSLISWKSKKQDVTSRSSTEAEYRSMAQTTCELLWIDQLLKDFQVTISSPAKLYCDNKSALHIASNPVFHERTKHIEIDCHTVRDQLKNGFLVALHVSTHNQLANILTKALGPTQFHSLLSRMSTSSLYLPPDQRLKT